MQRLLSATTNQIYDLGLKAFILLMPIIWLPGIEQKNLQFQFFSLGAIALFALGTVVTPQRRFKNYVLLLLLGCGIILSLIKSPTGIAMALLHLTFACLLYYSVVSNVFNIKSILKVFGYLVILNLGVMGLQLLGIDPLYTHDLSCIDKIHLTNCGLMARGYHLAFFLAFISPLVFLGKSWKLLLLIPIIGALWIIKSWIAMFAFLIGISIYGYLQLKKNKLFIPIIGGLLSLSFITIFYERIISKISVRLPVWEGIFKEGFSNPFIGRGLGVSTDNLFSFSIGNMFGSSFNEMLNLAFQFGLIPFGIITYFLVKYFRGLFRVQRSNISNALIGSLGAVFTISMFHEVLHAPRLAVIILVLVALLEASLLNDKEDECLK